MDLTKPADVKQKIAQLNELVDSWRDEVPLAARLSASETAAVAMCIGSAQELINWLEGRHSKIAVRTCADCAAVGARTLADGRVICPMMSASRGNLPDAACVYAESDFREKRDWHLHRASILSGVLSWPAGLAEWATTVERASARATVAECVSAANRMFRVLPTAAEVFGSTETKTVGGVTDVLPDPK